MESNGIFPLLKVFCAALNVQPNNEILIYYDII